MGYWQSIDVRVSSGKQLMSARVKRQKTANAAMLFNRKADSCKGKYAIHLIRGIVFNTLC